MSPYIRILSERVYSVEEFMFGQACRILIGEGIKPRVRVKMGRA